MLLNRIELFLTVAKHQNLGKTAREMHVSASSVCQRLKSLENDFGVKLYKKKKEGIELTGAGQALLATGSEVLTQLQNLRKTLNPDPKIAVRSLTIAGTYGPSAKYLPSAIAAFQKMHPKIDLRFLTADIPSIERLLRNFEVDIAIMQSPSKSSDFNMEHFAEDILTFFTHPMHRLAKKKNLGVEDLAESPLIIREERGATHKVLQQLKRRGLTVNVALRCASPDAVKAAVRQKMGVGILFYNVIAEDIRRKNLKILNFSGLPGLLGNSYIVYNKGKPLSPSANDFLTLLRSMKTQIKNSGNISEIGRERNGPVMYTAFQSAG
jgi:DNA-binding transcriptional LysR family regulator